MEQLSSLQPRAIAQLLVEDLNGVGALTCEPRLAGFAILEDGVMFGFVASDGTAYLRANATSAQRFHALGSHKHPEMPYWSIPQRAASDLKTLREFALEACDVAHIAFSFGLNDLDPYPTPTPMRGLLSAVSFTLLAA